MELWERQSKESYPAFEAFKVFLTERNYRQVGKILSKSERLMKRWSKEHNWRERADAWDNELSRRALEKASEEYAAMIERQINISRMMQAKAANAIQQMDLTDLPPKFLPALTAMVSAGVKIERSARELENAKPQENLLVETLTRVWERSDDDDK